MKIYAVCWSNSTQDDDGNSKAYGDAWKAYTTLEEAKAGLEECKNEFITEIVQGLAGDELEEALQDIEIYGSADELYFEICNCYWDVTYIKISELYLLKK